MCKMKVVIITTDEPFYIPLTIEKLLKGKWGDCISSIVLLPPTAKKRRWKTIIREQLNFGIIYFLYRSFQYFLYKLLSKLRIRLFNRYYSVVSIANVCGVKIFKVSNVNSEQSINFLKAESPDLIVSISASQIFSEKVINIARYATINVHNSPLPRYQGLMPSFWVLYNDEKQTATTVHLMAKRVDTGDILIQKFIDISPHETLNSLIKKTKLLTVKALEETFDLYHKYNGKPPATPLNLADATYFSFPSKKEIKEFKKRGKKLLWKGIY